MFELVDAKYRDQKDFAEAVNVKPQRVSEWRLRKSHSYVKRLEIISNKLETTPEYLLTGEGPKHKGEGIYTPKEIVEFMALLERFKLLSADSQKEVAAFIDFKLSQEGKSETVIDPASGSAGFLYRAAKHLENMGGTDVECFAIEQLPLEKSK